MTTSNPPLDTGTRLAVERTQLAHERTLMAWVRTATSLISFGFTIYKFFDFEAGRGAAAATNRLLSPREFGMIMIAIGVVSLALATVQHHRTSKRMRHAYGEGDRSVALIVAVIVSVMGLVALFVTAFRG
jgi:putative membrane protein